MKHNHIFHLLAVVLLSACQANDEAIVPDAALEIRGITAAIDGDNVAATRATDETTVTVGRAAFAANDKIVFTEIRRTNSPLKEFTYKNIRYLYDGKSWARTEVESGKEKIYWTDGASAHTFVGYSLPSSDYPFDNGDGTYAGELGRDFTTAIDFSTGNDVMKAEDLLLNFNANTKAETGGLSTKVSFAHALSQVRVVVDIDDYAAGDIDKQLTVANMVIQQQPTKFTWTAQGTNIDLVPTGQSYKDIKLLQSGFTFYGLTTPHLDNVDFSFDVTYPKALNPSETVTKTYKGTFENVQFYSGKCTTLTIMLNHRNEQMYMSVTYNDWNLVPTPDLGVLRKKSTYMTMNVDNTAIKTHSQVDNIDDAIWLYESNNVVKDVYGNDGTSAATAFRITSALQMLAFAKEVNSGYDFTGKYVRLDADITMQSSATAEDYQWKGIGEGSNVFNGTFLGGDRYINRLSGSSLFAALGEQACVEQLYITTIGSVANGALTSTNAGVIGGCKVIDDVNLTGESAGALVGTNDSTGVIHASYYTGTGALIGNQTAENHGTIVGCYQASDITSFTKEFLTNFIDGTDGENPTNGLNDDLNAFYSNESNSKKFRTKFNYTFTPGNYPTVFVK
jgi:hypothetical protein